MNATCTLDSPLGPLTLAGEGDRITGLWMRGQKYFGATLKGETPSGELSVFDRARDWLDRYFAGENPLMDLPLAPSGSAFRQSVWRILLQIPYGELTTYGEIAGQLARQLGIPRVSAQAVGGAVGHNPISILIPCHRVVGAGGSLTGYAGGIEQKLRLLTLEGAPVEGLFLPKRGTAL